MEIKSIPAFLIVAMFLALVASIALAPQGKAQDKAQDKYTLKALDGVAFSEFKGYEDWQTVAVSRTVHDVKAILANPAMIKAYKDGIPANGKPFPDGVKIVKIMWKPKPNPLSPYAVEVPDTLDVLAFIEKDSKRFPDSNGWGYAQFNYDPAAHTFKPYGADASFGTKYCFACHTAVKSRDYIFTDFAFR